MTKGSNIQSHLELKMYMRLFIYLLLQNFLTGRNLPVFHHSAQTPLHLCSPQRCKMQIWILIKSVSCLWVEQMQSGILGLFRVYPCGVRMRRHLVEHQDSFRRGKRKYFLTQLEAAPPGAWRRTM